ncbi:MerR family DNA-binding transcriptional regulator (plasmid) [Pseudorhodobacter turbinis]|uniref:MerR family DNA-binding transcriptional regulator n=1 Tax=Pseudorhodobacter turbinis TaxID=2500533 RepID=A0A4P8EJ27_9RHOB|nr:MerR family DNA-binding transcriptional regulator [Pseudorhodobacter turbinis]QCO57171.1 MerR family DNA-binding transcriptional regulator [Pseudorhodobacter turbinis]
MTDTPMTIREMCDKFNVTPRALRFYETKELIFPTREGTKRLYTRRDCVRLELLLRGKRFGFSLEDIRQLLDMYDLEGSERTQFMQTYTLAQDRLAQMEQQREELTEAIAELKSELADNAEQFKAYATADKKSAA